MAQENSANRPFRGRPSLTFGNPDDPSPVEPIVTPPIITTEPDNSPPAHPDLPSPSGSLLKADPLDDAVRTASRPTSVDLSGPPNGILKVSGGSASHSPNASPTSSRPVSMNKSVNFGEKEGEKQAPKLKEATKSLRDMRGELGLRGKKRRTTGSINANSFDSDDKTANGKEDIGLTFSSGSLEIAKGGVAALRLKYERLLYNETHARQELAEALEEEKKRRIAAEEKNAELVQQLESLRQLLVLQLEQIVDKTAAIETVDGLIATRKRSGTQPETVIPKELQAQSHAKRASLDERHLVNGTPKVPSLVNALVRNATESVSAASKDAAEKSPRMLPISPRGQHGVSPRERTERDKVVSPRSSDQFPVPPESPRSDSQESLDGSDTDNAELEADKKKKSKLTLFRGRKKKPSLTKVDLGVASEKPLGTPDKSEKPTSPRSHDESQDKESKRTHGDHGEEQIERESHRLSVEISKKDKKRETKKDKEERKREEKREKERKKDAKKSEKESKKRFKTEKSPSSPNLPGHPQAPLSPNLSASRRFASSEPLNGGKGRVMDRIMEEHGDVDADDHTTMRLIPNASPSNDIIREPSIPLARTSEPPFLKKEDKKGKSHSYIRRKPVQLDQNISRMNSSDAVTKDTSALPRKIEDKPSYNSPRPDKDRMHKAEHLDRPRSTTSSAGSTISFRTVSRPPLELESQRLSAEYIDPRRLASADSPKKKDKYKKDKAKSSGAPIRKSMPANMHRMMEISNMQPKVIEQAISYLRATSLDVPDLFCDDISLKAVAELRAHVEGGKKTMEHFERHGGAVVAEFIKHYFASQLESLIPQSLFDSFMDVADIQTTNLRANAMHSLIDSIPISNKCMLSSLLELFSALVKNETTNNVSEAKLSAIFGPLVMHEKSDTALTSSMDKKRSFIVQELITEYETLFVRMDEEWQFIPKDGRQLLCAARVDQIVEKLMDPYYKETEFIDIVLLTHVYYISSLDLLEKLIAIYEQHNPLHETAILDWQHKIRVRILHLMHKWIFNDYRYLLEEPGFIEKCQQFASPNTSLPDNRSSIIEEEETVFAFLRTFLATLEEKKKKDRPLATRSISFYHEARRERHRGMTLPDTLPGALAPLPEDEERLKEERDKETGSDDETEGADGETENVSVPEAENAAAGDTPVKEGDEPPHAAITVLSEKSPSDSVNILQLDPSTIAEQLTLIDNDLFLAVNKKELIKKRFMTPALSPSFTAMVHRFNKTGEWVSVEILRRDTPSLRASIINLFIRIGMHLRRLNNFNCLFAILGGLNSTPISRLKSTWEKVQKKEMGEFKKLMKLVHTDGNYLKYRRTLPESKPPLIPYLALFSRDLFGIEEGTSTLLSVDVVNFNKMRLVYKVIQQFASYQVHYSAIPMQAELRAYLKTVTPISENDQYALSYKLEPRKT